MVAFALPAICHRFLLGHVGIEAFWEDMERIPRQGQENHVPGIVPKTGLVLSKITSLLTTPSLRVCISEVVPFRMFSIMFTNVVFPARRIDQTKNWSRVPITRWCTSLRAVLRTPCLHWS